MGQASDMVKRYKTNVKMAMPGYEKNGEQVYSPTGFSIIFNPHYETSDIAVQDFIEQSPYFIRGEIWLVKIF